HSQHDRSITPGMKQKGKRSAGKPHAAFDVAVAGNVTMVAGLRSTTKVMELPPAATVRAPALDPTCVQRRLACSAEDKPAGARVSSPVAWIAGRRETEFLKPIDERSPWETCELSGCNENERGCGLESEKLRRPSLQL